MLLYYITDRRSFAGVEADRRRELLRRIGEAANAGVDYVQLREKDLDAAELELLTREALHSIRRNSSRTKFLVNTRVEVALSAGADGVHLPANSPPAGTVREEWKNATGKEPLIGFSTHLLSDLQQAELQSASFAVFGPIFEKDGLEAKGIGLEALRQACAVSCVPVFALGGVTLNNAKSCLDAGARGVAAIRLFQQGDVAETVERLRRL
jgi:thiamine-phosphate pyrophosphorylase